MKKTVKALTLGLCLALGACALAACDGGKDPSGPADGYARVSFMDGTSQISYTDVELGGKVDRPTEDPSKKGYDFVRWYATPSYTIAFDFDMEIEKNTSVYAGFRSQAADDHTWFILGESQSSDLFKECGWKDVAQGTDPDNLPDEITLKKSETQGNLFTITADFYAGDKFQIVNTDDGWSNQIGYGYISPELQSAADDAQVKSGGGLGDGAKKANIQIGVSGNYTFSLYVDKDGKLTEVSYIRNGDAAELAVEFNYFIKGENITQWQDMVVPYTQFATEDWKTYELEIGMKENDEFMFLTTKRGDLTEATTGVNSSVMALATDADTAAAVEAPTGSPNFKIKGGEGTYKFTITEGDDDTVTLKAAKTADTLPEYDFYVKGNMNGDTSWTERHAMTLGDDGKYAIEMELAADDEFMITVAEKGDEDKVEVIGAGIKYANKTLISNQVDMTGANFKVTAADKFVIKIDPVSMLVEIEGEHDVVTWVTSIYGKVNGGTGWADGAKIDIKSDSATLSGSITQELKVGDEFGFRTCKNGQQKGWFNASKEGWTGCDGLEGTGNITVTTAGTYKFDFVIQADGTIVSVTASVVTE